MQIQDLSQGIACSKKVSVTEYRKDGTTSKLEKYVLLENLLEVYINEKLSLQMVCTASDLPALIVGHLYSEGMIQSPEEIESIHICENASRARVFLTHPWKADDSVREIRACNCGANGILGRERMTGSEDIEKGLAAGSWNLEWAFRLTESFARESPLHAQTHGTHSAYLAADGEVRYVMEDIGRHNALDKVIGRALLDGMDLTQTMILTSGRVPVDMIQKVIRSKVPVLLSNTVPTEQALMLAETYGVTLITTARREHMEVSERV